ncbi:MAG: hypothetical protein K0R61_2165 [Microvirga sp.]|jgi:hypothetical protein|nr:hypothetical protein [Microvirga sp.]
MRDRAMGCPKGLLELLSDLTEASLHELYGTEEQCWHALFQLRWGHGWSCAQCGHERYATLKCRRVVQCNQCKHQASMTAGTIFENSKIPPLYGFVRSPC